MTSKLNPYVNFDGDAREAMSHYRDIFGGELTLMTYTEGGMAENPADAERIMHGQLETTAGFTLMGADAPTNMPSQASGGFSISLSGDDEGELRGYWERLLDGGSVTVPLEKAPWGDSFGMLTDRFGVPWMVNISGSAAG